MRDQVPKRYGEVLVIQQKYGRAPYVSVGYISNETKNRRIQTGKGDPILMWMYPPDWASMVEGRRRPDGQMPGTLYLVKSLEAFESEICRWDERAQVFRDEAGDIIHPAYWMEIEDIPAPLYAKAKKQFEEEQRKIRKSLVRAFQEREKERLDCSAPALQALRLPEHSREEHRARIA